MSMENLIRDLAIYILRTEDVMLLPVLKMRLDAIGDPRANLVDVYGDVNANRSVLQSFTWSILPPKHPTSRTAKAVFIDELTEVDAH